jgi:hypothetical protein
MSARDERPKGKQDAGSRQAAVVCTTCGFAWHSAVMAYGLRLLGSCPRCDGKLDFGDRTPRAPEEARGTAGAPHMALGLPRPPRRE